VSETGSVKFTCQQVPVEIGAFAGFAELNEYRRKLRELGLIGVDANGVGFGNLSIRDGATSRFYITGSASGGIADLIPSDYARVVAYDFARNWLQCEGSTVASSESLTHAAVLAFGRDVGEAFGVLSRAKGSPRPAKETRKPKSVRGMIV
jgi:hypothetical protein